MRPPTIARHTYVNMERDSLGRSAGRPVPRPSPARPPILPSWQDVEGLVDIESPQVIVDLSNVSRSGALGSACAQCAHTSGAHLDRLRRVLALWRGGFGELPTILLVADRSLVSRLCDQADRARLIAWKRDGLVEIPHYADPIILDRAEQFEAVTLSRDQFRAMRREREWMNHYSERFVRWDVTAGTTALVSGLPPAWEGDVTQAEEWDAMRASLFDDSDIASLTSRRWRCADPSCFARKLYPERLSVMPKKRLGAVVCPGCESPLEDLGPAPSSILVKVGIASIATAEFIVEEGHDFFIGRGSERSWDVVGDLPVRARVSRDHVELRNKNGSLLARDASSRNGTSVLRWVRSLAALQQSGILSADSWTAIGVDQALDLGNTGVIVRRSGRRWVVSAETDGSPGSGLADISQVTQFAPNDGA